MKAKPAAVIREVLPYFKFFTLIAEKPVHLMLQIIVMDFRICYLFQKNRAPISLSSGFPNVQE